MKAARIRRPTLAAPNAASRATTLNLWLAEKHGFDMGRPYMCREETSVDDDGNVTSMLIYEQDEAQ